ncbi:serine/threonine protein kinase with TPR repeat [gamma proteobacterium NOR5-3]|nr:serine/threonine protein kinase with TPR repeat [gamma proteobacterium NOR5-3]
MNRDISDIMREALSLREPERKAFLERACASDENLLASVTGLMSSPLKFDADSLPSGGRIGPYRLLDHLGDGGMGAVYLAEQHEPIERLVALKVLKEIQGTKENLVRFEAETRALALMSHPNVAAIIDAGKTGESQPYLAMEYVPGEAITAYCDHHRLNLHQRVELFLQVCAGVAHAHQKGVVHRDLKPANILVTRVDDTPVVKIIDFGLVKSLQRKFSPESLHTQIGTFVGTPLYSSPEQVDGAADLDTRSDIYSLGTVLYELITGVLPISGIGLDDRQSVRQLKEAPVPLPTTRFAGLAQETEKEAIASNRSLRTGELSQLLKEDIAWIVMKCLEKDRADRYPSIFLLINDLEAYRESRPVSARAPTFIYHLKKFIRRNRVTVAAVLAVVLAISFGVVSALVSNAESERQATLSTAVSQLMGDMLLTADPWNKDNRAGLTVRQVLDNLEGKLGRDELWTDSRYDRIRELGLEGALTLTLLYRIAQVRFSNGNLEGAEQNIRTAITLMSNDTPNHMRGSILLLEASVMAQQAHYDEARTQILNAVALVDPPQTPDEARVLLEALRARNILTLSGNRSPDDISFAEHVVATAKQQFGTESREHVRALILTARLRYHRLDIDEAIETSRRALEMGRRVRPLDHILVMRAANWLIAATYFREDGEEALNIAREQVDWTTTNLGDAHAASIAAYSKLSVMMTAADDPESARAVALHGLDLISTLDIVPPSIEEALQQALIESTFALGDYPECQRIAHQSLNKLSSSPAPIRAYQDVFTAYMAICSYYTGNLEQAKKMITSIDVAQSMQKGMAWAVLSRTELALGDDQSALEAADQSIVIGQPPAWDVYGFVYRKNGQLELSLKAFMDYPVVRGNGGDWYVISAVNAALNLIALDRYMEAEGVLGDIAPKGRQIDALVEFGRLALRQATGDDFEADMALEQLSVLTGRYLPHTLEYQSAKYALELMNIEIPDSIAQ